MNKRITSLLLSVVMICSMLVTAVPAWAAPGDSGVTASVTQAAPGDTFSVTLKVPGTEKPISDLSLKVRFDNTVFEVTEYTIPDIEGMSNMQSNVEEANRNAFFSAESFEKIVESQSHSRQPCLVVSLECYFLHLTAASSTGSPAL